MLQTTKMVPTIITKGDNMEIIRKPVSSFQSRSGMKPIVIVNHISAGSMQSMYNHFVNRNNKASSHYAVGRDGSIVQYVDIPSAAWTQGRIQSPTSPIIKAHMGNPNLYSISIEHEGYTGNGIDGDLTEEQFWATCWLHKHIQEEVRKIYGSTFELNSHTVIGHFQIDSKGKPNCPGKMFPWNRLYTELIAMNGVTMDQYEEMINFKTSIESEKVLAYSFAARTEDLRVKLKHDKYGKEAERKLLLLTPVLHHLSYSSYYDEVTAENIALRVRDIYTNSMLQKFEAAAIKKLLVAALYAKEVGI